MKFMILYKTEFKMEKIKLILNKN